MGYFDSNGKFIPTDPGDPGYTGPNAGAGGSPQFAGEPVVNRYSTDQNTQPDRPWVNINNQSAFQYGGLHGTDQAEEQRYAGLAASVEDRQAPQADLGQFNQDMQRQAGDRANQNGLYQQYNGLYTGYGAPSPAAQQLRQGLADTQARIGSQVASARGGAQARVAAQQAGSAAAGNASGAYGNQYAQLRALEQTGALQGMAQTSTSQRTADLQAQGLTADNAYKQAQIEAQQRGLNDYTNNAYENMRQNVFGSQLTAQQRGEALNQHATQLIKDQRQKNAERAQQNSNDAMNAAMTGVSAVIGGGVSDVRAKKDIGDGTPAVRQQMAAMNPYTYQYTDPGMEGAGPGPRVGVMAQDMERGPYGHQLVKNTKTGKKIDGPGGLSLALASGADHEQRLRELEAAAHPKALGYSLPEGTRRGLAAYPTAPTSIETLPASVPAATGPTYALPPNARRGLYAYPSAPTSLDLGGRR